MKHTLPFLITLLLVQTIVSHAATLPADTLYLRNREKRAVEVKEVYPDRVRFRPLNRPATELLSVPLAEVARIRYANGTQDEFNPLLPLPRPAITWTTQPPERTDKEDLALLACVLHQAQRVQAEVNGVAVPAGTRAIKTVGAACADGLSFSQSVRLREGDNQIVLVARNETGETRSAPLTIRYEKARKRIALVIGNGGYADPNRLTNPTNDAKAMATKLRDLGFEVIERQDTKQIDLRMVVAQFGNSLQNQPVDVALFYYAGHGIQVGGKNYLIPVDIIPQSESDVRVLAISADEVLDQMDTDQNQERTNIVILDACRDNPLTRSWTRSTGGKGLAGMSAPAGSVIAFSTKPGQTAQDGQAGNSPYTTALLKVLDEPGLQLEDIFKLVRVRVMQSTNSQQIPMENSLITRDVILNRVKEK